MPVASGDQDLIAKLGHAFHRRINLASDSRRLALLLSSVVRQLRSVVRQLRSVVRQLRSVVRQLRSVVRQLPNRFYAAIESHVSTARDDHERPIEALRSRDARTARSLMAQHILTRGDRLIELLEDRSLERPLGDKQESAS